ncbi:MAG: protein-L-isoaspartate(D-aspartate) O-methyltransferase [Candidatus Limnocylindrales bacterium]|jgi:protein-L-isoaspartate(D-aspartate) O-methyltransferase
MQSSGPDPFLSRRLALVRGLEAAGIHDPDVLAAFAQIRRELFVPPELVARAYDDSALGIGHGQTISQPYIVARMTELLGLRQPPAEATPDGTLAVPHALDVGTGSGYQAAILAALGIDVVSIERDAALSEAAVERLVRVGLAGRVHCVVGDGSEGWSSGAPYDGIVVAAAAPRVPEPLVAQLADLGRLVIPIGPRDLQTLYVVTRLGDRVDERRYDPCVFVPLVGQFGFEL